MRFLLTVVAIIVTYFYGFSNGWDKGVSDDREIMVRYLCDHAKFEIHTTPPTQPEKSIKPDPKEMIEKAKMAGQATQEAVIANALKGK